MIRVELMRLVANTKQIMSQSIEILATKLDSVCYLTFTKMNPLYHLICSVLDILKVRDLRKQLQAPVTPQLILTGFKSQAAVQVVTTYHYYGC